MSKRSLAVVPLNTILYYGQLILPVINLLVFLNKKWKPFFFRFVSCIFFNHQRKCYPTKAT